MLTYVMGRVFRKDAFSAKAGVGRNNCYAWALGYPALSTSGASYKLQPGDLSTMKDFSLSNCKEIVARVKDDLKQLGGSVTPFARPCSRSQYKIALVVAKDTDFHFLVHHQDVRYKVTEDGETRKSIARQFKVPINRVEKKQSYKKGSVVFVAGACCWSHKRGLAYAPTLLDAQGQIIKDPRKADLNYPGLNYSLFCATFCVPTREKTVCALVKNSKTRGLCVAKADSNHALIRKKLAPLKKSWNMVIF